MSQSGHRVLLHRHSMELVEAVEAGGARAVGLEGLAELEQPPLCAVLDLEDARQMLPELRNDPRHYTMPVLALIGHPAEGEFRDAFVAGVDDALVASDLGGVTRRIASLRSVDRRPPEDGALVLIVDDDVQRRRRFGRALIRTGMAVEFASSFEEAKTLTPPSVVVVHESLGDADDVRTVAREALGVPELCVVVIVESVASDFGGRRVERSATVPGNVPGDHLLFVINELLNLAASDQRASARLLYGTLCSFRRNGDLVPSYGLTYNISRDGLFVRTLDPPNHGEVVWLEIRPPLALGAVHLRATVAWRTLGGGSHPAGFAVQLLAHRCPSGDLETYRAHYRRLLESAQSDERGSAPPPTGSSPAVERGKRLLIADDEEPVRKALARLFRKSDIEVTLAADGKEAVDLYRRHRHDAVVADIRMPELSGIDMLKAIRADDEDVPVIITTGEPSMESAIAALEHGAIRYLVKPLDMKQLREAVDSAIGMSRLAHFRRQAALVAAQPNEKVDEIGKLSESLDRAVELLHAHYQPIVSYRERKVVAYETLARTSEPTIPHPGALFDAAERLGRLPEVGRRMREIAPEPFDTDTEANLFINLHPNDLLDERLYDTSSPLARMADRVKLEITERASLYGISDLRKRIGRLREIGYGIVVDDLGAGYAGLSAFVALGPDIVKLDMSLVRDVDQSRTKRRLIRSMVEVCDELGMRVIAEGVETVEELGVLIELGCDLFQGFLLARPGPAFPGVDWPEL